MFRTNMDRSLRGDSTRWANWESKLTERTCQECWDRHGKIVDISEMKKSFTKIIHFACQCLLLPMRTKEAGMVDSRDADIYIMYYGVLPNWYVTKKYAEAHGWIDWKGNLGDVLPEKRIGGDIYQNKEQKLPSLSGRIWYEADINYQNGYRNDSRILYSNDGLLFVTYDHYKTFYEIKE